MLDIDWTQIAQQVPALLIIAYVLIRIIAFMRETLDSIKESSTKFADAIKQVNETTLQFIATQLESNQEFIKAQEDGMNEAVKELSGEIRLNRADMIKELATLTQRIDGVIDKAIMLERLLPEDRRRGGRK